MEAFEPYPTKGTGENRRASTLLKGPAAPPANKGLRLSVSGEGGSSHLSTVPLSKLVARPLKPSGLNAEKNPLYAGDQSARQEHTVSMPASPRGMIGLDDSSLLMARDISPESEPDLVGPPVLDYSERGVQPTGLVGFDLSVPPACSSHHCDLKPQKETTPLSELRNCRPSGIVGSPTSHYLVAPINQWVNDSSLPSISINGSAIWATAVPTAQTELGTTTSPDPPSLDDRSSMEPRGLSSLSETNPAVSPVSTPYDQEVGVQRAGSGSSGRWNRQLLAPVTGDLLPSTVGDNVGLRKMSSSPSQITSRGNPITSIREGMSEAILVGESSKKALGTSTAEPQNSAFFGSNILGENYFWHGREDSGQEQPQ